MKYEQESGERAIVLLSGGLDSAVSLYWAISKRYRVQTLGMNYHRRGRKEIETARQLAKLNGVKHDEIDLQALKEIDDLNVKQNPALELVERAYIPSRNVIFYGFASYLAEICNAKYIVGGHNKDDAEKFPDSSSGFFRHFNEATKIGLASGDRTGRVILPLAKLSKVQVIRLGAKLKVPFELTWSCYNSSKKPCGTCHSCVLRKNSFLQAGIEDPLLIDK